MRGLSLKPYNFGDYHRHRRQWRRGRIADTDIILETPRDTGGKETSGKATSLGVIPATQRHAQHPL